MRTEISTDSQRALRRTVADYLTAHPEVHDQSEWGFDMNAEDHSIHVCGMAACVAGWAVRFSDPEVVFALRLEWMREIGHPLGPYTYLASRLLGLDEHDARDLCLENQDDADALDLLRSFDSEVTT